MRNFLSLCAFFKFVELKCSIIVFHTFSSVQNHGHGPNSQYLNPKSAQIEDNGFGVKTTTTIKKREPMSMISCKLFRDGFIKPKNISKICYCSFSTTKLRSHQYPFDTRKFAAQLERQGFSQTQSEAVLKALSSVLDSSVESLQSSLVSKEDFSRRAYQQKVDFAKLKSELQTLDKTEMTKVTSEHERIMIDIDKLRQKFREDINKSLSSVRLDLNLEKGRIREESAHHELKIKEANTRIDQELANFRTQIEGTKLQVLQWLIGVATGTFAMVMAYIRLLM